MKPEFFCCIGGELKDTIQGIFKCSRVFIYRAAENQTIDDMLVDGFFNEADDIRVNDLIILYCPEESRAYTFAKVSSIINGVVKTKELDIPNLADFADVAFSGLLSDLSDVTITNPQVGDCLQWDGEKWVNLSGGGGSATWGAVGGDITDQLDLQSALGNKANVGLDNLSATGQGKFDAKQNLIGGGTSGTLITNTGTPGTVSETSIDSSVTQGSNNPVSSDAVFNAIQGSIATLDVTNCITEIPQDIKLELNNGTLTLKAGSKVYVPNGVGVFDEITTTTDLSLSDTGFTQDYFIFYDSNNGTLSFEIIEGCFSGATAPTGYTYMNWYDTTNNLVKRTTDGGSTWANGYSLPIAFCRNIAGTGWININRLFNETGYMSKHMFALPGITGLIPNGRNSDGTLNNTVVTLSTVKVLEINDVSRKDVAVFLKSNQDLMAWGRNGGNVVYMKYRTPTAPTTYCRAYIESENLWYHSYGTTDWEPRDTSDEIVEICRVSTDIYPEIIEFVQKTTFSAVDTNQLQGLLNVIYPVGSIYIGTQATCPLATLIPGSVWQAVQGRYLLASGTLAGTSETYTAGNTVAAGLPNATGRGYDNVGDVHVNSANATAEGALYCGRKKNGFTLVYDGAGTADVNAISLDNSRSNSIYGQSATNRPTAFVVNVWRRTL